MDAFFSLWQPLAKAAQRTRGRGEAVREPSFNAAGWLEHCDVTGRDIIINLTNGVMKKRAPLFLTSMQDSV